MTGLQPRESRTERGPQLVYGLLPFNCGGSPVQISASDQHSCVVTDAGDLFTWGTCDEEGGALGHSHERWQPVAKRVPLLKKVCSARYSGLTGPLLVVVPMHQCNTARVAICHTDVPRVCCPLVRFAMLMAVDTKKASTSFLCSHSCRCSFHVSGYERRGCPQSYGGPVRRFLSFSATWRLICLCRSDEWGMRR